MMSRDKLRQIKSTARKMDFHPTTQLVHTLVDHGLDALTELEGGTSVMEQRAALKERERQVGLALADLGEVLDQIRTHNNDTFGQPKIFGDVARAKFTVDMIEQMLKAKGPQWNREWSHYAPRVEEEFGE